MGELASTLGAIALATGCALSLLFAATVRAGEDEAPSREDALAAAATVIERARSAKPRDKDVVTALTNSRADLAGWAEAARTAHWDGPDDQRDSDVGAAWNQLLTLSRYHGQELDDAYVVDRVDVMWKRLLIGVPVGEAWSYTRPKSPLDEIIPLSVNQTRPGGEPHRRINVRALLWNKDYYGGIAGSDCKMLAKNGLKQKRDAYEKRGRKASKRPSVVRLNDEFAKVHTFFVEGRPVGEDRRERFEVFFLKGEKWTGEIRIWTLLHPEEGDDAVTTWQLERSSPELAALLAASAFNPATKGK